VGQKASPHARASGGGTTSEGEGMIASSIAHSIDTMGLVLSLTGVALFVGLVMVASGLKDIARGLSMQAGAAQRQVGLNELRDRRENPLGGHR
jgi:hypothetical protein